MTPKILLLTGLGLSTIFLATWGTFAAKESYKYNSKMQEYGTLREKFFKNTSTKTLMCENKSQEECTGGKGYLPKPNENESWKEAYEIFIKNKTTKSVDKELLYVKNPEDLKDYCYEEIKKDLNNQKSFNPSGGTSHDLCVLNPYPAKK